MPSESLAGFSGNLGRIIPELVVECTGIRTLILFMFDAIRSDAKLIILDDPISSFDSNKKYAIINRLKDRRQK